MWRTAQANKCPGYIFKILVFYSNKLSDVSMASCKNRVFRCLENERGMWFDGGGVIGMINLKGCQFPF